VSRASRDKGQRGEREVAAIFKANGFRVERVPNSGGLLIKGDLYGDDRCPHVEVKRAERWDVPAWIRQARAESDGRPWLLALRRSNGPWYAVVELAGLVELLAKEGT
jgi:hypothetical protein